MRPRMSLVMSAGAIILLALVSGPASAQTPTVLFNFDGTHGEFPSGSLTLRPDGLTLYGMAHFGGAGGYGTIFSLPSIGGTPTVLFPFDSTHGSYPFYGSLTLSPDGLTLYGMTAQARNAPQRPTAPMSMRHIKSKLL